ncbi:RNA methyltransferase [Bifidobacterium sp. W8115]|uniref:TrmH family RNA methyltransferase n=1 Tax=Bifidobacterium TaxID=1678 RepID=UPI0018DE3F38|nr:MULTISPECIES: RNA methyltransferase [Bifidobacterium]MBI0071010.1 RNA methyltransferase [Bifidobacterium sp. W8112]MBI0124002.1 RNA methyltransferase [Bifidobacterium apousia]
MPFDDTLLDNPHAQRVHRLAELQDRRARQRHGRFLIEGPQSVREAVRWRPDLLTDLYIQADESSPAAQGGHRRPLNETVGAIMEQARELPDCYGHFVSARVMRAISSNAQGILAQAHTDGFLAQPTNLSDPRSLTGEGPDLVAAFWQIRDPGNAGTVIRTADAAGCRAVILVDQCVEPTNPKVIRSTAGSAFHIPLMTMDTDDFLALCRRQGRIMVAADVYGTPDKLVRSLTDLMASGALSQPDSAGQPMALLFGNEARGLPNELLQSMDQIVRIPIYGRAESLNLATSAAVLLYAMAMSSRIERM